MKPRKGRCPTCGYVWGWDGTPGEEAKCPNDATVLKLTRKPVQTVCTRAQVGLADPPVST